MKPLTSFHHHSDKSKYDRILSALNEGKNIAYCTDAGTPGVSDPGNALVKEVVERGFSAIPIPGPSAVAAIISVSGVDMQNFMFMGFPPHKKGRETFFKKIAQSDVSVVFYESPHRIVKNLELLGSVLEESKKGDRVIIVGREMTKMFEQIIRGNVSDVIGYFSKNTDKIKGEFVIIVV